MSRPPDSILFMRRSELSSEIDAIQMASQNHVPLKIGNHYVPQLYLKQWAVDKTILTYRLLVSHERVPMWTRKPLSGIAYHLHLYTYVGAEGATDEFEQWLEREFETPAASPIQKAINRQQMSTGDWTALIRFAAAQDVRTPARLIDFLRRQGEGMQELMDRTVAESVAKLERGEVTLQSTQAHSALSSSQGPFKVVTTPRENGTGQLEVRTVVGRRLWLSLFPHILTKTIAPLLKHQWTILRAPDGITWPTSDNPVVRLNYYKDGTYDLKGGWGVEGGEIFMPLNSQYLLYTKIGEKRAHPRNTRLDRNTALLLRRMIVQNAHRYVFDGTESDVAQIRPRIVNEEEFKTEEATWERWNTEQSDAEIELEEFGRRSTRSQPPSPGGNSGHP